MTTAFRPAPSVSHEAMLVDGDDERFRQVLFLGRVFADRLLVFREAIAREVGLSANQYAMMLAIAHAQREGGATVREVARYSLMAATHVTTQAGALIRKGLVVKRPNSEDGRSVLLSLTPKGERAMGVIAPMRQKFNDAFFEGVSRQSLLNAAKFLEQVTANSERGLPLLGRRAAKAGPATQPRIESKEITHEAGKRARHPRPAGTRLGRPERPGNPAAGDSRL